MLPSEDIARALSGLEKRIERLERLDQVFTINAGETVINEAGIDRNLRIEGLTDPNLVFVDAGTNRVGIGTNVPLSKEHIVGGVTVLLRLDDVTTNLTTKTGRFGTTHYTTAEQPVGMFFQATLNSNAISIGGGSGLLNAATLIRFFLATNTVTVTGTEVFRLTLANIVFNETGRDTNVRMEGNADPNLFFSDAGNDNIGIGTAAPNASAKLEIASTTGSLLIPRMTTVQRNALAAVNGMGIYNTTTNQFEKYQAGAWVAW